MVVLCRAFPTNCGWLLAFGAEGLCEPFLGVVAQLALVLRLWQRMPDQQQLAPVGPASPAQHNVKGQRQARTKRQSSVHGFREQARRILTGRRHAVEEFSEHRQSRVSG